jgi:small subunit ribosomal protein S19
MPRSVWKGPFVDAHVLKKAQKSRESGRNEVIRTWSRRSTILPQFVGLTFGVYNGKKHIPVSVTEEMTLSTSTAQHSPTAKGPGAEGSPAYASENPVACTRA